MGGGGIVTAVSSGHSGRTLTIWPPYLGEIKLPFPSRNDLSCCPDVQDPADAGHCEHTGTKGKAI